MAAPEAEIMHGDGEQPHSDGPFNSPPERRRIRRATNVVERREALADASQRFWRGVRRWAMWISSGFVGLVATLIAGRQLYDMIVTLLQRVKGGP